MHSPATNKKPVRRTHCDVNSREVGLWNAMSEPMPLAE